jgi:hypothetical protein
MSTSELPRGDLTASLAARRELGPDYDAAFVEAVAERIELATAARRPISAETEKGERAVRLTIACVSLGVSIPVTAIAGVQAGLPGIVVVWLAIAVINVAYALRPQHR